MDQPILNFESEEERRQYQRAQRREYQREYQREYRRRQRERLTDDQREEERRRQSEARRQRNARRAENESSRSIERVAETPRPRSQFENNLGAEGDAQNRQNTNGIIRADFQRFQMQFRHQLDRFRMPSMCYICQECYLGIKVNRSSQGPICTRCRQERGNNRFSASNNMDPGPQPEELASLTQVEEMLIARVNPILQVTHATGGQYKYKGHTISFPQNVEHISNILPHTIDHLPIIIVRRRDQRGTNYNFTVNRDRVYRALKYKIEHDKYYSDVIVNENALNDLSSNFDENIFNRLKTVHIEFDSDANEIIFVGPIMETDEGNTIDHTNSMASKLPNAQKEMELIHAWINNPDTNQTALIDWPAIGTSPINEYVTLGLLDMAFPTLFPDGRCDWLEPRMRRVHLHEFVKHLLRYRDHRFGQHPRFKYFMMNMIMRHRAQNSSAVFVKRGFHDMPITINELRQHMENMPQSHLANRLMRFGTSLRGTRSYWAKCCAELTDMLHQIGSPTIFFTLSVADMYWPDLHALMSGTSPTTPREAQNWRKQNAFQNFPLHPCLKNTRQLAEIDIDKDYEEILNCVERHTLCREGACLRKKRGRMVCRYNAPWPLNLSGSKLYEDIETGEKKFEPARNDDRVNSHNRHILQLWRANIDWQPVLSKHAVVKYIAKANIDWQPVLSKHAVVKYIAKYAAKAEKSSETYHQMLMSLSNMEDPNDLATRAYRRLLTETIIERDIGAQETCHMLLELPLVESSRRFVNLNVSHEVFKPVTINDEENNEEQTKSFIDGYKTRPLCMEGVTLIDAARSWIYNPERKRDNKWEPRERAAIVRVFPRFVSLPPRESNKWIDFCLSELLLYKPFRDIERDIGHDDDSMIANWESFTYNPWHVERITSIENAEANTDSEIEENEAIQRNTTEHEWEIISRLHHGQNIQFLEIDMLGRRDIDRHTNWSTDYQGEEYTTTAISFITNMKDHGCLIYDDIPQCINYMTLSDKQKKAVDIIMTHYQRNQNKVPLFMIIQGTTGTGKSYLIGAISQALENAAMPSRSPLLLLAPTGVAAFNIGASTVHSKLRIPIRDFTQLQGTRLAIFQEEMAHSKYILIDEMSFIGQNMLENIDSRLRQAYPQSAHLSFAGISMILVGDLGQLPPVNDRPAYASNRRAKLLWEEFKIVVTLDKIFRQDGENIQQQRFRQLLTNLRDANPQIDDWKLLMMRTPTNIDVASNSEFENTVHLFSTNDNVHSHNKKMLYSLRHPVARSVATKAGSVNIAEDFSTGELDLELLISKNSRVMLTSNLWIQAGLVNGALGYVQKIVYKPGSAPPDPPTYVMVEFDNYSRLPFEYHHPNTIPITTIQKGRTLQLPLRLAWALTIHKSQGLTLPKVTIDIGPRERTGLTFVAVSRVKSLEGLRIMPPFTYDRYEKMKKGRQLAKRKAEENRLKLLEDN
ncbi:uncharacterized protein LOC131860191 [Cryptomeria japonica]|uniref:uncharacterized protein LOC131860191 n=1 Tax=Cryptomeria japonica TaxID=3369 RepID=UPI0027D9D20D|nr:uncharacterized protein LOC131860191 [Cryptomeria japonica]